MQISKEELTKTKVKLTIKLTKEEIVPHITKVYQELAKGLKIAGFRPGKAPQFMVEREIGQDKFYAEVLEDILPQAYYQSILKENLLTVSRPEVKVTKYVPTEGLEFDAEVEIVPEITLPDYKKIKVKKNEIKVTDKDIDNLLADLKNKYAEYKEVERAVVKGDKAEIDFEGTKNNVPIQGGSSKNHPLIVGQGMFIPGFEDNLIGMRKDEEKLFEITFPADYHEKTLAGQKVTFKVKILVVSEKILPELTDEFARNLGPFKSLEELRKQVEVDIAKTKEIEERRRSEDEILAKIAKQTEFAVPETLIHEEIHKMMREADTSLQNSGLTLEKYLEMTKKTAEEMEKEMRPEAEKRVKYGLILSKISQAEKITASQKEIEEEKEKILATFGENANDYRAKLNDHEAEHSIENSIVARKTIDKLISYCLN